MYYTLSIFCVWLKAGEGGRHIIVIYVFLNTQLLVLLLDNLRSLAERPC